MTEDQKKILGMAVEFHELCNRYGIRHYLACGSCLGAIRNNGFIPWDDDVDFMMTREGIEKLIGIFKERDFENRALIGKGIVEGYHEEPYRYVSTVDTSIQRSTMHYDCPLGTYVDILVLDPMPKSEKERHKYEKRMGLYFELSNDVYTTQPLGERYSSKCYVILKKLENILGKDFFLKRVRKYLRSFSEEECDYYAASWQGTIKLSFPKKLFGEMRLELFEDTFLPVPSQAEKYLRESFGDDWMYEPEPEAERTHIIVADRDISYDVYYKDYMSHLNRDEWISIQKNKKILENRLLPSKKLINKTALNLEALRVRCSLEQCLMNNEIILEKLLKSKKYDEIISIYKEYIHKQFGYSGNKFRYWKHFLALPDELLYPIWYSMCMRGKIYEIEKVLKWRKEQGKSTLSEALIKLEGLVKEAVCCCRVFYEDKDIEKAYRRSISCLTEHPDIPQLQYIKYVWLISQKETMKETETLKNEIQYILSQWEMNGEVRKCLADILAFEENYSLAKCNYIRAMKDTSNGILRKEIRNILKKKEFKEEGV